ncbi:TolC family protein [uncultured Ferrimonas sp.]|uniref:TolC family protein n=1 Tax=uncultured Ferrimonas sp. TaxID=432640 RepID=UPI00262AE31E|nr:TolC family protein [uncultured Ferrimonas sp.]
MKTRFKAVAWALSVGLTLPVAAAPLPPEPNAVEPVPSWPQLVLAQLQQLPQLQSAAAALQQQQFAVNRASQALYNPELAAEVENMGGDGAAEYQLGISQTIDWADKRGLQTRLAQLQAQQAQASHQLQRNQLLLQLLNHYSQWALAQQQDNWHAQQQQQFALLVQQTRQKVQVGDVAPLDLQLLQLEQARLLAQRSHSQQALLQQQGQLQALGSSLWQLPIQLDEISLPSGPTAISPRLPALQPAYKAVQIARAEMALTQGQQQWDPTVSIGVKHSGNEQSLNLGISVPLALRNRGQAELQQAQQQLLLAELQLSEHQQRLSIELESLTAQWQLLSSNYGQWQQLALQPLASSQALLQKQWRSGELTTPNFVQAQQQLLATHSAGAQLQTQRQQAALALLAARGELETWLQHRR